MERSERLCVQRCDAHLDSDQDSREYYLLDRVVKQIRRFRTISVSDSSVYEHCNEHMKRTCKRPSQRTQTLMMEVLNVMKSTYENALSNKTDQIGVTLRREKKEVRSPNRMLSILYVVG